MKKKLTMVEKMGIARPKAPDDDKELSAFERRLKMVNRARVVNHAGLGGPVFKIRQTEPEA
jgi:hypothetical protein